MMQNIRRTDTNIKVNYIKIARKKSFQLRRVDDLEEKRLSNAMYDHYKELCTNGTRRSSPAKYLMNLRDAETFLSALPPRGRFELGIPLATLFQACPSSLLGFKDPTFD